MTSLVLDLRDNPGGFLDEAVRIAAKFLSEGKAIVTQKGRNRASESRYASLNRQPDKSPLVVLVNDQTASGAEIVVGALQHHGRALIVGQPTFGQNLVQIYIPLEYGSALTLTSSRSLRAAAISRGLESASSLMPDAMVAARQTTATQKRMIDPVFGFARMLVNGRINGFQSYKVDGPVDFKHQLKPDEFQVSNDLFDAFKKFVANEPAYGLTSKQLDANRVFISRQLRHHIATAAYGPVMASRVLLADDPQLLKAIEVLPRAAALVGASRD